MVFELDAERVEIAQVQYYGWALKNRAAFIPTPEQLDHATEIVEKARVDLKGKIVIDYVIPDYYAKHPKNCMGGWGRQFLNLNPKGDVLPCHAAETIPHLKFDNVRERSLKWIWENSKLLICIGVQIGCQNHTNHDRKEIDWGGCRCQAMALRQVMQKIQIQPAQYRRYTMKYFLWQQKKRKVHHQNSFTEDMV